MAYASEALSLAALELFVNLPSSLLPVDPVAIEVRVPDDVSIEEWGRSTLPKGRAGADTQTLGADWVASGRTLLLRVPSAVVPQEWNVLINPAHPDFPRLSVQPPHPFHFDPRMQKEMR